MKLLRLLIVCLRAEQDEGLEKLEETLVSTKHIALAVSEELDLHTTLIVCFCIFSDSLIETLQFILDEHYIIFRSLMQDDLGQHVDVIDSHLQVKHFTIDKFLF